MRSGLKLLAGALLIVAASMMTLAMHSNKRARVILLGSPTPAPDLSNSGPAIAVVVDGRAYLFDAGPELVRASEAAAGKFGMPALQAEFLSRLFLTKLHSDHTLGYPDVMLTPWVVGRVEPLQVYGPQGTAEMTESLKQAYAADIKIRTEGLEGLSRQALNINVHEITAGGQIYRDANISVEALAMSRGSGIEALGYSVKAGGRNIVIAGNSVPRPALTEACDRCDLLLYEVFTAEGSNAVHGPDTDGYQRRVQQSMEELAEVAAKTRPKLLVLYHQLYLGSRAGVDLEEEIHRTYPGKVVLGRDLAAY